MKADVSKIYICELNQLYFQLPEFTPSLVLGKEMNFDFNRKKRMGKMSNLV